MLQDVFFVPLHQHHPCEDPAIFRAAPGCGELGLLQEFIDARALCAVSDAKGALRQLERVSDVMQHVPMPAMKLVAQGALAQGLRGVGSLSQRPVCGGA